MLVAELVRNAPFALELSPYSPFVYSGVVRSYTYASFWTTTFGAPDDSEQVRTNLKTITENYLNKYLVAVDVAGCIAQESSFYFDHAAQIIYIHMDHDAAPYADKVEYGFAFGMTDQEVLYINDYEYLPLIESVPNLEQSADIVGATQITGVSGSAKLINKAAGVDGPLDFLIDENVYGNDFFVYSYSEETQALTARAVLFIEKYSHTKSAVTLELQDKRKSQNKKIPTAVFDKTAYPYLSDSYVGDTIPLVYGTISELELTPINSELTKESNAVAAVYRLPDGLSSIGAAYVYLDDGNKTWTPANTPVADYVNMTLTIPSGDNLTTKSGRGTSGSTRKCKLVGCVGIMFSGHSYPADIIVDLNERFLGLVYNAANYDTTEWAAESASSLMTADIGFVLREQKELYEVIFDICNKAKNIFRYEFTPDNRITLRVRDFDRAVSGYIESCEIRNNDELPIDSEPSAVFSSVVLKYAHNYVEGTDLSLEVSTHYDDVVSKYRVVEALPIDTFLVAKADALARADADALMYSDVPRVSKLDIFGYQSLKIFDTLNIALVDDDLYADSREYFGIRKCLVLSIDPDEAAGVNHITALVAPAASTAARIERAIADEYAYPYRENVEETAAVAAAALVDAATAQGTGAAAQGTADAAASAASVADGKAVVADGKAVAAQGTANTADAKANALNLVTGTPTPTPAAPTAVFSVYKRSLTIDIQPQSSLQGFVRFEAQISRDGSNWFKPNFTASVDSVADTDWKSGGDTGVYAFNAPSFTLGFLPIQLTASGRPLAAGQAYALRVRTVAGSTSAWTTSGTLTVLATTHADTVDAMMDYTNVDYAKWIKARDPAAPIDGLAGWYSFDDLPAVPDGASPTYLSNFSSSVDGWNAWIDCTLSFSGNKLIVTGGGGSATLGFYASRDSNGKHVRFVIPYDSDIVSVMWHNGTTNASIPLVRHGKNYILDYLATTPGYPYTSLLITYASAAIEGTKAVQIEVIYIGDGAYAAGWPRDNSGSGNHGTACVGVVPCAGVSGNALDFNGSTAHVVIPPSFSGMGNFSISVWAKFDVVNAGQILFKMGLDDGNGYKAYFVFLDSGPIRAEWGNGLGRLTGPTPSAGEWVHIVAVYNGSTNSLYINGALYASVAYSGSNISLTDFRLGSYNGTLTMLNGSLDEFRIYSRDLSPEEIAYLYTNPGGPQAGTVYADQIYAGAITAKLAEISNLDVDQYARVIRLNSQAIYDGTDARCDAAQDAAGTLYQVPSPSPVAGKYAWGYHDLSGGRLRAGNATKYMYVDGPGGIASFKGIDLDAATITAGSAVYSSDGKIAIRGDASNNTFGDGLCFASFDQKAGGGAANDFKRSTNFATGGANGGVVEELRLYSASWATLYPFVKDQHVVGTDTSAYRFIEIGTAVNKKAKISLQSIAAAAPEIVMSITDGGTGLAVSLNTLNGFYPATAINLGGASYPWSAVWANKFVTSLVDAVASATGWTNWFQPANGESGLIFDISTATASQLDIYYYYNSNGTLGRALLAGTGNEIQVSGTWIQYTGKASRTMRFARIVLT